MTWARQKYQPKYYIHYNDDGYVNNDNNDLDYYKKRYKTNFSGDFQYMLNTLDLTEVSNNYSTIYHTLYYPDNVYQYVANYINTGILQSISGKRIVAFDGWDYAEKCYDLINDKTNTEYAPHNYNWYNGNLRYSQHIIITYNYRLDSIYYYSHPKLILSFGSHGLSYHLGHFYRWVYTQDEDEDYPTWKNRSYGYLKVIRF